MSHSTLITDYLGTGTIATRPVSPNLPAGCLGVWLASDTGEASLWNGTAWQDIASVNTVISGNGIAQTGSIFGTGTLSLKVGAGLSFNGGGSLVATVSSLSNGAGIQSVTGGTIVATYQTGTIVSAFGTGLSVSAGTLSATGVASLSAGAGISSVSGGTIVANWNGGTVGALAANQLVISSTTLGIKTGPTIQATQSSAPIVLNSNTSTAYPTLSTNTGVAIIGADNLGNALESWSVAGTLTGNSGNVTSIFGRVNGTFASPTNLKAADRVLGQSIRGYNGTIYATAMSVWNILVGSDWTGTNLEYLHTWATVPSGSTTTTERMRLSSAGALLIGTTAAVGSEKLRVVGDINVSGTSIVGGIIINAGSVITQPFGPGLTNSSGTLQALVGTGMTIASGTIQSQAQGTLTLSGTTTGTINPAGISSVLVNVGTANGTIDIQPGAVGQELRIEVKQGATAHTVTLVNPSFGYNATVTGYTATASANLRDLLKAICCDGTHWAVAAVVNGVTI